MKNVQVLLSSYNGEKYLKEQIDSILAQKNVSVELLIRDDGSTDGTKEILAQYERNFENITVCYEENEGVISSFFNLMDLADETVEYIAFADQDDVWLPEKLNRAVMLLEKKRCELQSDDTPLLYCSARQLVDEQLNHLPSAIKYPKVNPVFGNALVENMCTGCTCVFNRNLLLLLKHLRPDFTVMHDFWVYLVGTCFGQAVYDEETYILYRQHGNNELGSASTLLENYRRRVKNFKKHRGQLTKQAAELLRLYGAKMPAEQRQLVEELIEARHSLKTRWKLIKEKKVFRQRKSDDGIFKILLGAGQI